MICTIYNHHHHHHKQGGGRKDRQRNESRESKTTAAIGEKISPFFENAIKTIQNLILRSLCKMTSRHVSVPGMNDKLNGAGERGRGEGGEGEELGRN